VYISCYYLCYSSQMLVILLLYIFDCVNRLKAHLRHGKKDSVSRVDSVPLALYDIREAYERKWICAYVYVPYSYMKKNTSHQLIDM
jgi:hypothetical protein